MRKAILIFIVAIFIIGVIHIAVTPINYKSYTIEALWFASAGCTLIFLAFLNYVLISIKQRQTRFFVICHTANILCTILVAFILTIAFAPHIILLFVLLVSKTLLVIGLQFSSRF
ncbi:MULTISPECIES: hypothetical protein [unclassified Bacillus cereus group]|uniref:hypothetical protein n=1 Tax=unclassified Bacillus cereus group TaxID=2750818 RepID=UPI001F587932|nr:MULTISPECIES: hypothetical protein [unclassified Bacillus cereus group]